MDDNLLIAAVENRSVLYDNGNAGFKNPAIKESAWLSIAEALNASVAECIARWNALRDRYAKEKRLMEAETRSGAGSSNRTVWVYWSSTNFLNSHVRRRNSTDNLPQLPSGTRPARLPLTSPGTTSSSSVDDLDSFLMGNTADGPASFDSPVLTSCPTEMPSTSAVNIGSTKSAAASLPYFGSAGRCKRQKPDEAMQMFKETLMNLKQGMQAPVAPEASDPDVLIGQSVIACLKNLTDKKTKLQFRRMFRDLVQDCEEAALSD